MSDDTAFLREKKCRILAARIILAFSSVGRARVFLDRSTAVYISLPISFFDGHVER